jgi:hypothetical protein
MKYQLLATCLCLAAASVQADIVKISLGGASSGLSPANEVPAIGVPSTGSGGEILGGITFDTESRELNIAIGYGSSALFTDLTGPATGAHIHGPATQSDSAPVIHDFIAAGQHLAASHPEKGGVILGTVVLDEAQTADLMAGKYYINIHTEQNPGGEIRGQLLPQLNQAPTVQCPAPVVAECASHDGTPVTLTAHVADANGDALQVKWSIDGTVYQTTEVPAVQNGETGADVEFTGTFGMGEHNVTVTVSDGKADPVSCETKVTIQDTLPPVVTGVVPSQKVLWPPNHKMIPLVISVTATDQCGEVHSHIVSITSNEPVNGIGDGNTAPDWLQTGDLSLQLRAERAGGGSGRVYTITVKTVDDSGNSVMSTTTVRVPHDMGHDAGIPEGPANAGKQKSSNARGGVGVKGT